MIKCKESYQCRSGQQLRTPIQPILSSSEVLLSKINDSKHRELLDIVSRNANRLRRLAEDILDVSRIESHSLSLHKKQFNINDVIENVVQSYRSQIQVQNKVRSDTEILFTPKEDVILVEADKGRLIQVISNLLDNSLKFTKPAREGEKGKIHISSEKKDNQATVSIMDTGMGIEHRNISKAFFEICLEVLLRYRLRTLYLKKYNRRTWWQDMGPK